MLKNDLNLRNPLRLIHDANGGLLPPGGFGAVLSRSGGGKTALMVQVAMNAMLQGKKVLHVSLTDPVEKVALWYRELFIQMTRDYDRAPVDQLRDNLLSQRLIMTFRAHGFTPATLEERMNDLSQQQIFTPDLLVLDGLEFDQDSRSILTQLKEMAGRLRFHAWFTITTHRDEPMADNGSPLRLERVNDLFEIILQLKSGEGPVKIRMLKTPGSVRPAVPQNDLTLDPTTLLIQDRTA
jgi:hypothetical protein